MKCTCAECGITKNQIRQGKLIVPSQAGGDLFDAVVGNATDLFQHAPPWMGKKAVEMGRYYGSEALRNINLQKKTINYGLKRSLL